jgi:16S rRNA (cytosine967-C5)-methyltransferase
MPRKAVSASLRSATAQVSPARRAAFEILRRVEEDGAYASVLLATKIETLQGRDKGLVHQLVMGVLRHQLWLDCLIGHFSNRSASELDVPVRIALRLGLYQLRMMSRIPPSAAVNESVNLVRFAKLRSAAPFANAVLRRATREAEFDPTAATENLIEKLSIETSHPTWLLERWIRDWGWDEATAFARSNNDSAPVAFRIPGGHNREATVLDSLHEAGAQLTESSLVPNAWRIDEAPALFREFVDQGRVYVQDEASQLVARLVDPQAGERILDVCAAPGSKTTHMADLERTSLIVAADLHQHRLRTLCSSASKAKLTNVRALATDALQPMPLGDAMFDRVLVDAPCTGTGTLRRNPEIRWRLAPTDIVDLADRQLRILVNASRAVRSGGRLIYSTCSIEKDENEAVIEKFKTLAKDFEVASLDLDSSLLTESGAARVWPQRTGADGFFIAVLKRNKNRFMF